MEREEYETEIDGPCSLLSNEAPKESPLVDDAEVGQFLQNAADAAVALVERRFRDGIGAGEIPPDLPGAARASQALDLGRGLTMRAQMGAPRKTLLRDAEESAALALPPRRRNSAPDRRSWMA